MQKTAKKGSFPLEASVDGFLHVSCTNLEQDTTIISLQADVKVNDETTAKHTCIIHGLAIYSFVCFQSKRVDRCVWW